MSRPALKPPAPGDRRDEMPMSTPSAPDRRRPAPAALQGRGAAPVPGRRAPARTALAAALSSALVPALALLLGACGGDGAPEEPPPPEPRGIVFVVIDTLRADHVGLYGNERGLTPRLDALGAEGLVFDNTVAVSSWTRPSVASMFTGRYPTVIDVQTKQDILAPQLETVTELLKGHGLRTLAISTNGNAGKAFGFDQGFDEWVHKLPKHGYDSDQFKKVQGETVTTKALEMLDALPAEEPFFLFLHYIDPHDPYLPRPEFVDASAVGGRYDGSRTQLQQLDRLGPNLRTPEDVARIRELYAGEVAYGDHWLGELLDGLRERALYDESLVIVTSDHGEGLWDHGMRAHGFDLYEEQLRVPLVVKFPADRQVAPRRVTTFASLVDLAPTMLGVFNLPVPESWQGRDLGLAEREGKLERRGVFAYSEMDFTGIDLESVSNGEQKIIRDRAYDGDKAEAFDYVTVKDDTVDKISRKLFGRVPHVREIYELNADMLGPKEGGPIDRSTPLEVGLVLRMPPRKMPRDRDKFEWYLLKKDPGELEDLSATEEGRSTKMHEVLRHLAAENLARRIEGGQVALEDLDEETVAELRALGYIGGN